MTSGRAWRMPRWWSTVAEPIDSKGRWAIASSASRVLTRPRRTPVRSLRSRAGSMSVHTLGVPSGLAHHPDRVLGSPDVAVPDNGNRRAPLHVRDHLPVRLPGELLRARPGVDRDPPHPGALEHLGDFGSVGAGLVPADADFSG